jgi:hypothetical protein
MMIWFDTKPWASLATPATIMLKPQKHLVKENGLTQRPAHHDESTEAGPPKSFGRRRAGARKVAEKRFL